MKSRNMLIILAVIFLLILLANALFTVDMGEQVIITQMGEYVRTSKEPGLDMKIPFIQQVYRFDKKVLVSEAHPAEYLTLDKKRLVIDSYTRWKIDDPLKFYITVKNEFGALSRLEGIVFSELRTHIAAHDFIDIIGAKREPIMEEVAKKVGEIVRQFGIEVIDVRIKRADLPKEVQSSVYARMNAERQRIAKKYRAEGEEKARIIRANADKEATIILADAYKQSNTTKGEGDAAATAIYASAYGKDPEFYSFLRTLDTYDRIISSKTVLIMDSGNRLFRYLENPKPSE
jgi:membrane protease subunit HflC